MIEDKLSRGILIAFAATSLIGCATHSDQDSLIFTKREIETKSFEDKTGATLTFAKADFYNVGLNQVLIAAYSADSQLPLCLDFYEVVKTSGGIVIDLHGNQVEVPKSETYRLLAHDYSSLPIVSVSYETNVSPWRATVTRRLRGKDGPQETTYTLIYRDRAIIRNPSMSVISP